VRTHQFDEPLIVHYRAAATWHMVLALAVRKSEQNIYEVLIMHGHSEGTENMSWVPRSRIRDADAALPCAAGPESVLQPRRQAHE